jgi:hypothetical protein
MASHPYQLVVEYDESGCDSGGMGRDFNQDPPGIVTLPSTYYTYPVPRYVTAQHIPRLGTTGEAAAGKQSASRSLPGAVSPGLRRSAKVVVLPIPPVRARNSCGEGSLDSPLCKLGWKGGVSAKWRPCRLAGSLSHLC